MPRVIIRRLSPLVFCCLVALGVGGCDGGGHDEDGVGTAGHGANDLSCDADDAAEEYLAGMAKTGQAGVLTVTLLSSIPAPPDKGDNAWNIRVEDSGGSPVTGATIITEPKMVHHGHGTPVVAQSTESTDEPGTYEIGPVNMFMAGRWETRIQVTTAGGDVDTVVFNFCVEG